MSVFDSSSIKNLARNLEILEEEFPGSKWQVDMDSFEIYGAVCGFKVNFIWSGPDEYLSKPASWSVMCVNVADFEPEAKQSFTLPDCVKLLQRALYKQAEVLTEYTKEWERAHLGVGKE